MIRCKTCDRDVDMECGAPLIPNGFLLYDPIGDCDVPDADLCERIDCPHDTRTARYSRMLPPLGSMGEKAFNPAAPELDEFPF